jgi:cobalt-zinc-cadmium efflux system outer membrane protein
MYLKYLFVFGFTLLVGTIGCAWHTKDDVWQVQLPLGREYKAFHPPSKASDISSVQKLENPTGAVTLQQALALGLLQNPELKSFFWEVRSAEARALQAGLLPNPEIETSVENFEGEKEQKEFRSAETTVQISQLIELGGKRSKRKHLSNLEKNLAGWDYESKRLDVFTEITKAYWDVFAAQERLTITSELAWLSEETYNTVVERVKAGKVPPVEEIQAKVSLTTAKIEFEQTKRELETARRKLAATWGSTLTTFEKVSGVIDTAAPIPPQEQLENLIVQNPDVARWAAEVEKNRANVKLKDTSAIPDITIGAGPRYFNETDNTAFVMALSMPIPIFNRNQGEKLEARYSLAKAEEEQKASLVRARTELGQAYQELSSAFLSASSLKDTALPGADIAFNASLEGYREGKFNYLVVLDSQRTLFEVKRQYVNALTDYHKARANIERLIAQNLP